MNYAWREKFKTEFMFSEILVRPMHMLYLQRDFPFFYTKRLGLKNLNRFFCVQNDSFSAFFKKTSESLISRFVKHPFTDPKSDPSVAGGATVKPNTSWNSGTEVCKTLNDRLVNKDSNNCIPDAPVSQSFFVCRAASPGCRGY